MALLISLIIFALSINTVNSQMGIGGGKKKTYSPEKRDLPYISCDVCAGTVINLHLQVTKARAEYGPKSPKGKNMPEEVVSDILDGVCKGNKESGEWIRYMDIVSQAADGQDKKRKLALKPHENPGKCKKECETISKSCYDLIEEEIEDRDELQALLYVDRKFNEYSGEGGDMKLVDHVCKKMTSRCKSQKTYATSKYDRKDEEFVEVSQKDLEMEKLMAQMQGMPGMEGQRMSMFDRDDMDNMGSMMDGYDDEYGGYGGYGDDPYGGMPDLGTGGGGGDMEL